MLDIMTYNTSFYNAILLKMYYFKVIIGNKICY